MIYLFVSVITLSNEGWFQWNLKKHWPKTHLGAKFGEGQRSCRVNIDHLSWLMWNCDQYCEKYSSTVIWHCIFRSDTVCVELNNHKRDDCVSPIMAYLCDCVIQPQCMLVNMSWAERGSWKNEGMTFHLIRWITKYLNK